MHHVTVIIRKWFSYIGKVVTGLQFELICKGMIDPLAKAHTHASKNEGDWCKIMVITYATLAVGRLKEEEEEEVER